PQIEQAHIGHIFDEGFTTKDEPEHGMGLYIVRSIVESVGGKARVTSTPERTTFIVELPKMTIER
ncbi:MAG: ATP-binding protein, partial [Cellulosilyticaceae bacterium]